MENIRVFFFSVQHTGHSQNSSIHWIETTFQNPKCLLILNLLHFMREHTRQDYKGTIFSFVNHSISRWFCSVLFHIGFLPTVCAVVSELCFTSSVLSATLFVLWTSDSHALRMGKLEAMTCACADHDLQTSMRIRGGPVSARMERMFQKHASFQRDELQLVE